ncbi:MAG: excinuclease ABC subunit UvrC [Candidatus Electryonea clarkiae]|nr:excinuclease ABC subunit UvrC [Candidatus Electryonea clarkiae]MDP8289258.1 excinuclease ABC subunit UvrC [Candidatus Electryonea clarkiae]
MDQELPIQEKLELLPRDPGCYIFRDERGKVIYVGKAKVLRNRVRSYFSGRSDGRYQYDKLISRIHDLEIIVTAGEVEALVLEANLIRRFRPRFNIDVKDDRSYPYLKVTRELFPRIFITREERGREADYYGPLSDVTKIKETVNALRRACHIRICNLKITDESIRLKKHRICLEYHIGNCEAPCVGYVTPEHYNSDVGKLVDTFHGKATTLLEMLEKRMDNYSVEQKYEEAAHVRDQLYAIKKLNTRQEKLAADTNDRDVFGIALEDRSGCIAVLRIRNGKMVGRDRAYLSRLDGSSEKEIWARFLERYYVSDLRMIPRQILIPVQIDPDDKTLLKLYIEEKRGRKVEIRVPQRGDLIRMITLARHNAELLLSERRLAEAKRERVPHGLKMLQEHLDLPELPRIIECFDNSNLFGTYPVAAMVQFKDARPEKKEYRHYRIKTVEGIDDFASMREVVGRRYQRLKKEGREMPNIILIDGGIGQVNASRKILDDMGLDYLPAVGLAKRLEEIILPGAPGPITLPKTSSALKLLMQIRDEAHRFAITFHRKLRASAAISTTLTSLPGIGSAKARVLLKHFGSLKRLKSATPEQIAQVPGFSVEGGKNILLLLNQDNTSK